MRRTPVSADAGDPYRHASWARDDLEIRCRPIANPKRKANAAVMVVSTVAVAGYAAFTLLALLTNGGPVLAVGLVGVLLGLATLLLWFTAKMVANRKVVAVRGNTLRAYERPLSLAPARQVGVDSVDQLWVEYRSAPSDDVGTIETCALMLRTRDGKDVALLDGIESPREALWIEQEIEDCLGLVDIAVDGEIPPAAES